VVALAIDESPLWTEYAPTYDLLYWILPVQAALKEGVDALGVTSASRILDLGCGTGFLMRILSEFFGIQPSIVGLDLTAEMLEFAEGVPYLGNFRAQLANLNDPHTAWGLGTDRFDCLIANNSLYAVADPAGVLRELHAVAAPRARLVVSTPRPGASEQAIEDEHLRLFEAAGGDVEAERQRVRKLYAAIKQLNKDRILANTKFHFPTARELIGWFDPALWDLSYIGTTYVRQNWRAVAIRR
jgi:SAM-dependent methyltransferase